MSKAPKQPIAVVRPIAEEFLAKYCTFYEITGSLRRQERMIGDVDAVVADDLATLRIKFGTEVEVLRGKNDVLFVQYKGIVFNLFHAAPDYWGAMLFYTTGPTGSQIHYRGVARARGQTLNQKGLFDKTGKCLASKTEKDMYQAFGKPYKEPHLRGK
jgi:DNA polymerase/3'-5' exonuclease PolX